MRSFESWGQSEVDRRCKRHALITSTWAAFQGWGGGLRIDLTLSRRVSKCHSHSLCALSASRHSLLAAEYVLTFIKLVSLRLNSCDKSFKRGLHLTLDKRRDQEMASTALALCIKLQICSSSASCCGLEAIEWEDLVSVRLHQLPFNETERGVQLQPGRRTDIEVLIRPGSQESLTWRLSVVLYCWSTVIAFPSVSHIMDGQ